MVIQSLGKMLQFSDSDAWLLRMHAVATSSPYWIPIYRLTWLLYINVQHCGRLSLVLLQLKPHLKLFKKIREFLPGSRFLFRRDKTY